MSRLRGQWLSDDGSDLPPRRLRRARRFGGRRDGTQTAGDVIAAAAAEDAAAMGATDAASRHSSALRGFWLDDDGEQYDRSSSGISSPDDASDAAERRAEAVPQWTTWMPGVAGVLVALGLVLAFAGNTNVLRGLIVVPVLAGIVYQIAKRLAVADGRPEVVPIVMGGFVMKLVCILLRYWVALGYYGAADATQYNIYGRAYAPQLRHFHMPDTGKLTGSNFVRFLTGIVYAITPASMLVGFLVFGFLSFLGVLFFWRAYRRSISDQHDLVFLQVMVLLPSMIFWPSALGKDAWMLFAVGMAAFGAANILANRTIVGWGTFSLGMLAIAQVRPHVGIPLLVGLAFAELFRSRGSQGAGRAGLNLLLLFLIGGSLLAATASFVGLGKWSQASVTQELDNVAGRTNEGGSNFKPFPVTSPVRFPPAAGTVLFRPLPYEAHSPQELVTAIEDVCILGYALKNIRKVAYAFRQARRRPFLLFCIGTIILFIIEYSTFSNFGLLARERTQITALLFTLLMVPPIEPTQVEQPRVRPSETAALA